jgi:hypothetical protein
MPSYNYDRTPAALVARANEALETIKKCTEAALNVLYVSRDLYVNGNFAGAESALRLPRETGDIKRQAAIQTYQETLDELGRLSEAERQEALSLLGVPYPDQA